MGALLEDKKVAEVSSAELDGLRGREESLRLELKETLQGTDAYELAKDLLSMANAEGGYYVVGAVQDKKTERCTGFKSVENPDPIFKKIKSIAADHIQSAWPSNLSCVRRAQAKVLCWSKSPKRPSRLP
jgi:hypothetical protein